MDMKTLLFAAAGIAGFFVAYHTGNKTKAILLPAVITGILGMLPVLSDPKSLSFFGFVGLAVFVLLASFACGVSATVGCVIGSFVRRKSGLTSHSSGTPDGAP